MDNTSPTRQSELFMLRLWPEEQGDGAIAWRGRIQHALTGRTAYFQGWPALATVLDNFLSEPTPKRRAQGEI